MQNEFNLKKLEFGRNDGKKEAELDDFESLYYDYNGLLHDSLDKFKFLVLGRKGTGKTLLAEMIKKKADGVDNWFCKIDNYKQFKIEELKKLKQDTYINTDEYSAVWEWVVLIEIGKIIINKNITLDMYCEQLKDFFKTNLFRLELGSYKTIEHIAKYKISGKLGISSSIGVSGEGNEEAKSEYGTYLDYLPSLKEVIFKILENNKDKKITLIYDELDLKFRDEDDYKNSIISLIKTSNDLNDEFIKNKISTKVMIFLRQDIFNLLNDYDLNKIKEDCSITIDWGTNMSAMSPLVDMAINKIKNSHIIFQNKSKQEIIKLLFGKVKYQYRQKRGKSSCNSIEPFDYILTRSFLRPRDVVTYLKKITEEYPREQKIKGEYIKQVEAKYSEYFTKEIKNELKGHLADNEIDTIFLLLYRFSKPVFFYSELDDYLKARTDIFGNLDLKKCISLLFKFSAIGTHRYDKMRRKTFYKWCYRENNVEINFEEKIVIHHGLRKELNLY